MKKIPSEPIVGVTGRPRGAATSLGWLLPCGFGALTVLLYTSSRSIEIPIAPAQVVDRASLVVGPRRVAMTDPAHILVGGRAQNCNGCHQIFKSGSPAGAVLNYHEDIRLGHGMNSRCANCHDSEDRERLTLRDGATVSFAQTPQLCAQCHGTVYRDWERGTHGKTLGSWVTRSESQYRLSCNECHNPHSPRYEPYVPLPGPNTLRMGARSSSPSHDHGPKQSPLQRWLREANATESKHPAPNGSHE